MKYHYFDAHIDSSVSLPELCPATDGATLASINDEGATEPTIDWMHEWRDEQDNTEIRIGRDASAWFIQFPEFDQETFRVDDGLSEISRRGSRCPPATSRHLLLDQVLPRVIGQRGLPVIHAAAVSSGPGKALLLVGDSGAGKSTIAHALEVSVPKTIVLADDCVLVRPGKSGFSCFGNYPGCRLLPDSLEAFGLDERETNDFADHSPKRRVVGSPSSAVGDHQVSLIVILERRDDLILPEVSELSSSSAAISIQKQRFMIDPTDHSISARHLSLISEMMATSKVVRLEFAHDFDQLDRVTKLIQSIQ